MSTTHGAFDPLTNQMPNTQLAIAAACDEIKELLLEKNAKYGDSALNPVRVFSNSSPVEQLLVRIDDKLSRIKRGAGLLGVDEDVRKDLIGYLVLLGIAMERSAPESGNSLDYKEIKNFYSFELDMQTDQWDGIDIEPGSYTCK